MSNSREKILTSATECFFQHGYAAANISMIARYAEISRVTIHKQFKSKETLFRAVFEKHITNSNERLKFYANSVGDFWSETETFIIARCGGLFEEIPSALIRSDLVHACQSHCQDIIQKSEIKVRETINNRIIKEIDAKRFTLQRIDMTSEEFSRVIESAPFGLALSSLEEDHPAFVGQLMKVFKASTTIEIT